jgi:cellulose synthase/poly-beta-1,6-N-acetylglucosamine synthase-like glycosyltransferase
LDKDKRKIRFARKNSQVEIRLNAIVYYQINTRLSEQKYRLAIPFAENNFGPFKHIAFVIALFASPSKTLFRVLFASLYLQICIFYHGISISCPAVSSRLEISLTQQEIRLKIRQKARALMHYLCTKSI